jgi:hypothetical protein
VRYARARSPRTSKHARSQSELRDARASHAHAHAARTATRRVALRCVVRMGWGRGLR